MKTYALYGIGITLASAILTLVLMAAGFLTNPEKLGMAFLILMCFLLIILIVGIVMATKATRAEAANRGFSYGQAWKAAVLTVVFAAIFGCVFNFVYYSYINPNYNEVAMQWTRSMMENRGVSSEKVEKQMDEMRAKGTVERQLINGFIFTIILGSIIGLITAAVMKRPPVEDLTQAAPPPLG